MSLIGVDPKKYNFALPKRTVGSFQPVLQNLPNFTLAPLPPSPLPEAMAHQMDPALVREIRNLPGNDVCYLSLWPATVHDLMG